MKRTSISILIVGLVVSMSSMTISTSAQQVESASSQVMTKKISVAKQKATLAFWTHEAISSAQALAVPSSSGPATIDASSPSRESVTGPPAIAAAGMAGANADKVAEAAYPQDWAALRAQSQQSIESLGEPAGASQVFTSYTVNEASVLQTLYPHRWVGRLSFSTPNGTSYCSGTSISGNVMLTAAHCLYDSTNNTWYSNWALTPAYRNGSAPYGTFVATQCWILTSWVNLSGSYNINSWAPHDVGVCKMGKNSAGVTLNNAVGWMGRQWNAPYIRHFHDLGYPFRDYNNALMTNAGLYLRTCTAESFQQTTEVRGMGCNYGGGISGGPWMINYAPNVAGGAADGVNSGLYIGTQNLYGARFNSNNIVPLCTAAAC